MITIIFDHYDLGSGEIPDTTVENEQQYIISRLQIRDAIHQGASLLVVVKNRRIAGWYESLRDYSDVAIRAVSPKSVIVAKLGLPQSLSMNLPLSDSEISEFGLTEKATNHPPKSAIRTLKDVENWVLSVCIGECWSEAAASYSHLSRLISFFLTGGTDPFGKNAPGELVRQRVAEWVSSSLGGVYKWLFESPLLNSLTVYASQVTKQYEKPMRQKILAEIVTNKPAHLIVDHIEQIPSCECSDNIPNKLELNSLVEIKWKSSLKDRLRYRMADMKGMDKREAGRERFEETLREAINRMSGCLLGELNAIVTVIQENPVHFNRGMFNLLSAKFYRFLPMIRELEDLIPREVPSVIEQNWDWPKASRWLISEYMPYAQWSLEYVTDDSTLEQRAQEYGDWLYYNYPSMKNHLDPLNYGTWYRIKDHLDKGYQVLWIIIDNLCWFYIDDATAAFREAGFYPTSSGLIAQLSMLPSETKISKTALIAGKLPCQLEPDSFQKYAEVFEQCCKESGINSYRTIPDNELRVGRLGREKVTCCIINKLDVSSHQGFFDFRDEVKSTLANIAKYLKSYIPPEVNAQKLVVLISTDHGSCKVPSHIKGSAIPKTATLDEQHKRFAYVDTGDGLSESLYYLDKDRFGLTRSIAIMKGYGFFGSNRPKALVHGGMTPEETFIPLLEFSLQTVEFKEIKCVHESLPVHLSPRKQPVQLIIRNSNQSTVNDLHIFVPSHSVEIDIDEILAKDEKLVSVEVALPKEATPVSKQGIAVLKGYYSLKYQGERKSGEIEIDLNIRRIIEVPDQQDRLLEF